MDARIFPETMIAPNYGYTGSGRRPSQGPTVHATNTPNPQGPTDSTDSTTTADAWGKIVDCFVRAIESVGNEIKGTAEALATFTRVLMDTIEPEESIPVEEPPYLLPSNERIPMSTVLAIRSEPP